MLRPAYSATGIAITPLLRLWLQRRTVRGKEESSRLPERFGRASTPRPAGKLIWLHAASVGETQSVLTLVRALLAAHPALHLLITTGTVTSAQLVAQQNLPRTLHQYVPLDTYPAVRRFLAHWQPDLALWVESEFWPQLLWQTHARRIPLLLINARISARSYAGWQRWPSIIHALLQCFSTIYAGSSDDAARASALGGKNVHDIGNLKFDAEPLGVDTALLAQLEAAAGDRPRWVAASTHANEEQQIAEIHQQLLKELPTLLTIIVPRHANRGDAIALDLRSRGCSVAQRSKNEPITQHTQIYLADTMGELGSFYRFANIAFLGGSLVAHGGHNPLEPARLGCAIITGPHTHNFTAIMQKMLQAQAIEVVQHKQHLAQLLNRWLADPTPAHAMAERADILLQQAQGASATIVQQCGELLGRAP
ncbi:MAG: 3-deoxy-D-manno-octulosonic acid transferase [Rickettsiales bacterium]